MASVFAPAYRGGSGSPLVCLHGFTDTWRTWELILPALERLHEVFAPTLPGHAGGPPLPAPLSIAAVTDLVEGMMDDVGWKTAHLVGNSLGGYLALQLAARGRAETVVALAPAGGWARTDPTFKDMLSRQIAMHEMAKVAAPHASTILRSEAGRRRATELITVNYAHIPVELLAHQMLGVAACRDVAAMVANAMREDWSLDASKIACPVRIVWGTDDKLLQWPSAAERFRRDVLPHADWVELEGVGHCPQLDVPQETAALILDFASG